MVMNEFRQLIRTTKTKPCQEKHKSITVTYERKSIQGSARSKLPTVSLYSQKLQGLH